MRCASLSHPVRRGVLSARERSQRGVALVLVLTILAVMTLMAGSFALSTQRESALISHARDRAEAQALAEGGIHYAMLMLSLPDMTQRWKADGTLYFWQTPAGRVRIRIFDESGKLDINGAQEQTLRAFFGRILGNDDAASRMVDSILDWRDGDELRRMHGAEADDYRGASRETVPGNRNFYLMDELRGVLGMTPELYRRLEPLLTVYTGRDGINPSRASREALLALTGDQARVDEFIRQRAESPGQPFPPIAGIQFHAVGDTAYTVSAVAELPGERFGGLDAVVKRGRGPDGSPFAYLYWKPHAQASATAQ